MGIYSAFSPNGRIELQIVLEDGRMSYQVLADGVCAIAPSPLGLKTDICDFTCGLTVTGVEHGSIDESYRIPAFKKARCMDIARTMALTVEREGHSLCLKTRVYDDGAALRYQMEGSGPVQVLKEQTAYALPKAAGGIYAQRYIFTYEDHYPLVPREDLWQNAYAFPMLVQLPAEKWALYAEAAVYGSSYGGANLCSSRENPGLLRVCRAPDQLEPICEKLPLKTPWRAVIVGGLNSIMESNLLENLNPPSILEDESFIRPGRSAWSWMTEGRSPQDPQRQKEYIDYAAQMGFEYSLIDGGWPGHVDIPEMVAYAKEKGVKIWIWEHSAAMRDAAEAEEKMKLWSSWGVVGLKIDFFESDGQKRIGQYTMLASLAARYRLMINFHGCSKPTGTSRLWPHVLAYEGVMGGEYLQNFSTFLPGGPNAVHNCTLPFTRNAVGPMDYTPIVYRTYQTGTSDAHQTALSVIFTSYVLHVGEKAEVVLENPCRPFLEAVPTAWDETKLLEGFPGSYVTVARRRGSDWFIAGICANRPRSAQLKLDFLTGQYDAQLYADDLSGDTPFDASVGALPLPNAEDCAKMDASHSRRTLHQHDLHAVRIERRSIQAGEEIAVPMCAGGGFAMVLRAK